MRRKPGALIPIEISILEAGIDLQERGTPQAHGYLLARQIKDREGARRLTGYGTLYKALDRMERAGYLESEWEDPSAAAAERRPRRRFYRVTAAGQSVYRESLFTAHRGPALRPAAGTGSP